MKIISIIFNFLFFAFTCLVLLTDGTSKESVYILLTLLSLLVPIFNVMVILRIGKTNGSGKQVSTSDVEFIKKSHVSPPVKITALMCNIAWFGFFCWAFMDQYPHPEEKGFFLYLLFAMLTPVLSFTTIWYSRAHKT